MWSEKPEPMVGPGLEKICGVILCWNFLETKTDQKVRLLGVHLNRLVFLENISVHLNEFYHNFSSCQNISLHFGMSHSS
jgi:hypothetical protein